MIQFATLTNRYCRLTKTSPGFAFVRWLLAGLSLGLYYDIVKLWLVRDNQRLDCLPLLACGLISYRPGPLIPYHAYLGRHP